jgi:hypothetical protein
MAGQMCGLPVRKTSYNLTATTTVFTGLSFLLIAIRVATRVSGLSGEAMLGWDDLFVAGSFATAVPITVFVPYMVKFGLGQDIWEVQPYSGISNMLRLFYFCQLHYILSVNFVKIALVLFFLRVFPQYWFRRWCWVMIGIVVAFGFAYLFPTTFQCKPINYAWNQWDGEHEGHCIDISTGTYVNASLNMVLDLVILLMPMPLLIRLHVTYSRKQKALILIMFSTGIVVTLVSALRVRTLFVYGKTTNPTWDFVDVGLWSIVEIHVGIMCACLPQLRAFIFTVMPRWFGYTMPGATTGATTSGGLSKNSRGGQLASGTRSRTPKVVISNPGNTDRSDHTFTELDELDDTYPIQGAKPAHGRVHYSSKTWAESSEREGSAHSDPASTKQWS